MAPKFRLTAGDVERIARNLSLRPPELAECCINDWSRRCGGRKLHEDLRLNSPREVGATATLHARWGHPTLPEFVDTYFASTGGGQAEDRGRTPDHIRSLCERLYEHALESGPKRCAYTPNNVTEWFCYLVFVRTVMGGLAERAFFDRVAGVAAGWRFSTWLEDTGWGVDLVHDVAKLAVQVKPQSWWKNEARVAKWKGAVLAPGFSIFVATYSPKDTLFEFEVLELVHSTFLPADVSVIVARTKA